MLSRFILFIEFCSVVWLLGSSGCVFAPAPTVPSGFLVTYEGFEASPRLIGSFEYLDPLVNLRRYNRFMIDPVIAFPGPFASNAPVDSAQRAQLVEYFQSALIEQLEARYELVEQRGEGVLRLRAALTELNPAMPFLDLKVLGKFGYTPGAATLELEVSDSISGKRVFAFIDRRRSVDLRPGGSLDDQFDNRRTLDFWAEYIRWRFDIIQGSYAAYH